MPSFPTKGSTGQAPTTSFFGAIPDKFNMLYPAHVVGVQYYWDSALAPANLVNQWTIFNTSFSGGANANTVSLGSLATAPDGTNTGQHITETSTNSIHALTAGFNANHGTVDQIGNLRLAVIAKAAERTRIALQLSDEIPSSGIRTVYDLAGGQIGVAPTPFGSVAGASFSYRSLGAGMWPLGGGWYVCFMDVVESVSPDNHVFAEFYLDAGSGTGAMNITYAGDGASGVYAWRSTALPVGAWGMSGQVVFFDDFNSLSTIDMTNSLAPGFNWYINNTFPWVATQGYTSPYTPSLISVAGSILTLNGINAAPGGGLVTIGWTGGSNYVGSTFTIPALFETKFSWAQLDEAGGTNNNTFWTSSLKGVLTHFGPAAAGVKVGEIDFFESQPGGAPDYAPATSLFAGFGTDQTPFVSLQSAIVSYSPGGLLQWQPGLTYSGVGVTVFYSGTMYSNLTTNKNVPPPTSLGVDWQVASPATGFPSLANTPILDFSQLNTFSSLIIPWTTASGVSVAGSIVTFLNGLFCAQYYWDPTASTHYGAPIFTGYIQYIADGEQFPLFLWAQSANVGGTINCDFVRVTQ